MHRKIFYPVCIIFCIGSGCKKDVVTAPKAGFDFAVANAGLLPATVNFTSKSARAAQYFWDFGDGHTSTAANPVNTYQDAGTYNVKQVVIGAGGKDSITKSVNITLNKPNANFDVTLSNASQVPCTVSFTNTTTNAVSYKWYFPDGTTAAEKNATASYSRPGSYTIKLVASNQAGSDSVTKTFVVNPIMKSVVTYLITPKDKKFNQRYYDILKNAVISLQGWYKAQLGNNKTFVTNPMIVDTLTGLHDSTWYNSPGPNSGTDPRYYGYYNTLYELQQLLGSGFNTTNYVYFVYVAAPGGGAGSTGFCAMGDQDLKGLLGENPEWWDPKRWIGGGGHELGHAFGLPHPDNQNPQAIMWTGYATYPNCILQQADKDILNASLFFK